MSRLEDMIAYAQANGPITLNDLLTELDYKDPSLRASARTQLCRALDEGGEYRELAISGIIRPSASAREARWEKDLQRYPDKHPVVLESRALAPVRDIKTENYSQELKESVRSVLATNITGRKGAAIAQAIRDYDHALELERVKREAAEERFRTQKAVAEEYKQMVDTLSKFIKGNGTSLIPPK